MNSCKSTLFPHLIEIILGILIIYISLIHPKFVFIHKTKDCKPTDITSQTRDQYSIQSSDLILKCDNLCYNPIKNESAPYRNNLFLFNIWRYESTSSAYNFIFPIKTNIQQKDKFIILPTNNTKHLNKWWKCFRHHVTINKALKQAQFDHTEHFNEYMIKAINNKLNTYHMYISKLTGTIAH